MRVCVQAWVCVRECVCACVWFLWAAGVGEDIAVCVREPSLAHAGLPRRPHATALSTNSLSDRL